jgi:hypothetical protein
MVSAQRRATSSLDPLCRSYSRTAPRHTLFHKNYGLCLVFEDSLCMPLALFLSFDGLFVTYCSDDCLILNGFSVEMIFGGKK